jgi:hypothetical protein
MIRLILLVLLIAAGLAFVFLPWYYLVGGIVVLILVGFLVLKLFGGRLLKALFILPFKAKGAVLRGASIEVHYVVPAEPPEPPAQPGTGEVDAEAETDEAKEDATPRTWYFLDVTITPNPPKGKFTMWEPGELRLVKPETESPEDEDNSCRIAKVQIYDGQAFQDDEGLKFGGPQYLRLHIGVDPAISRLRFLYYFEAFGDIAIPSATPGGDA